MSLSKKITECEREIAGSIAKNRLSFQISYGMKLIMDFYDADYVILMDYIEDIAVLNSLEHPESIKLYQIKTKNTARQLTLTTVISEKWLNKLYKSAIQFGEFFVEGELVCNEDIVHSGANAFSNAKNCLDSTTVAAACQIKKAIADDLGIAENEVDLSKFYITRTQLTTANHKNEVEHEFETFLLSKKADIQVDMARAIYKCLYNILDDRFNQELSEKATDIDEIIKKKGVSSIEIDALLDDAIGMQLPNIEQIFTFFHIDDLRECRRLSGKYATLKKDMRANLKTFSELRKRIFECIEANISVGKKTELVNIIYLELSQADDFPVPYKEENYLKLLIMVMTIKYREGN
jgi:hypothetical protein